ncbi:cell death-inducing p53-target protein 1-like [Limulus polyphemus]|uniref:Cell death-inducing p53-target protein 1-like n=1 Tax=Limulus polyphemus TaxID=6850 RepID=A0ABM1BSK3_LIMPO|nr:cell death-inducing p53-target protein 1-like [Limulus polyphemus]
MEQGLKDFPESSTQYKLLMENQNPVASCPQLIPQSPEEGIVGDFSHSSWQNQPPPQYSGPSLSPNISQPMSANTTTVVCHQITAQQPTPIATRFGIAPVQTRCLECGNVIMTSISRKVGCAACCWSFWLCLFGVTCPIFWVPCVTDTCKSTVHRCPACGSKIGTHTGPCCCGCC